VGLKACASQMKQNLKPNLGYFPEFQSFHELGYSPFIYANLLTFKYQNMLL